MSNRRISLLIAIACMVMGACKKIVAPVTAPDSELAFFNVSQYLIGETPQIAGKCYVLLDSPAAAYPTFSFGDDQSTDNVTNTAQPWVLYMHVYPGAHSLALTDTGAHHELVRQEITTSAQYPTTVFYADSLGVFNSWVTKDTLISLPGQVRIRLLDLSPDAGSLFFTVNSQTPPQGAPSVLQYGSVTSFVDYPNITADTTLLLSFYNPGDTTDLITAAQFQASPGHSYTVLINGYENAQYLTDPFTGGSSSYPPDLKASVYQNN